MAFEVFKRSNIPNRGVAVAVNQRGQLALSEAAHHELGETRHVTLLYDREAHIVGIRACDDPTDGFLVTNSRLINATSFVKAFNVPLARTVRWPAEMRDGILCVDVGKEGVPVSSNRAKRVGHQDSSGVRSNRRRCPS